MDNIHGSNPWIISMDIIHGYYPWKFSMNIIHRCYQWDPRGGTMGAPWVGSLNLLGLMGPLGLMGLQGLLGPQGLTGNPGVMLQLRFQVPWQVSREGATNSEAPTAIRAGAVGTG